jgi:hypothetical protein
MGTTNYATTTISLAKFVDMNEVSEESRDSTYFHELVHCILGEMCHDLNNNEEFVQTVSTFVNQIYQGLGFKLQATFLASCRQGIFFLPVILVLPHIIDILGVQSAQSIADMCTFFTSIPFIIIFYKKYITEKDNSL